MRHSLFYAASTFQLFLGSDITEAIFEVQKVRKITENGCFRDFKGPILSFKDILIKKPHFLPKLRYLTKKASSN